MIRSSVKQEASPPCPGIRSIGLASPLHLDNHPLRKTFATCKQIGHLAMLNFS